jgi:hypothetical protein
MFLFCFCVSCLVYFQSLTLVLGCFIWFCSVLTEGDIQNVNTQLLFQNHMKAGPLQGSGGGGGLGKVIADWFSLIYFNLYCHSFWVCFVIR